MKNYAEIIQQLRNLAHRYHTDAGFRARMDADPAATLRGEGYDRVLPKKASVRLHPDDAKTMHIVFPPRPIPVVAEEDENLGGIAGGYCADCVGYGGHHWGGACGASLCVG